MELSNVRFGFGDHKPTADPTGDRDTCTMEAIAFFAGGSWGRKPSCVSSRISYFLRYWQDSLSDEDRDRLLPAEKWVPRLVGSWGDDVTELHRVGLMQDWLVRIYTPAWLDLVPELAEHAAAFRAFPESPYLGVYSTCSDSIREDKWRDELQAAAVGVRIVSKKDQRWIFLSSEEKETAWFAARRAVEDSAGGAAKDVALAAVTASRSAATWAFILGADLNPTVKTLQQSALDLLDRMLLCSQK